MSTRRKSRLEHFQEALAPSNSFLVNGVACAIPSEDVPVRLKLCACGRCVLFPSIEDSIDTLNATNLNCPKCCFSEYSTDLLNGGECLEYVQLYMKTSDSQNSKVTLNT